MGSLRYFLAGVRPLDRYLAAVALVSATLAILAATSGVAVALRERLFDGLAVLSAGTSVPQAR